MDTDSVPAAAVNLRVVCGRPTAEELAAVVTVLLLALRDPDAVAAATSGHAPATHPPGWLRGPYSAPIAWTAQA